MSSSPLDPTLEGCGAGNGAGSQPGTEPVWTVDELATFLRLDRKAVYASIGRGEIPGVRRIGRIIRISRSAVLAWLEQGQGRVSRSRR